MELIELHRIDFKHEIERVLFRIYFVLFERDYLYANLFPLVQLRFFDVAQKFLHIGFNGSVCNAFPVAFFAVYEIVIQKIIAVVHQITLIRCCLHPFYISCEKRQE